MQFDIKLKSQDMYRFNMYQTYTGFHGWFSIIVSIIIFIVAGLTYGGLDITYTVLYIAFGIIFLLYMPVTLWLRSKSALAASEVLRGTLHYLVDENGFTVSQGEESANLPWDQIYKMVATKSNVLVYSTRINAYIIPREQLGEQYKELAKIANVDLNAYGMDMLKAGTDLSDFTPEQLINIDSKPFCTKGVKYQVAQVNTASIDDVMKDKDKIEEAMAKFMHKNEEDLFVFLITDIISNNSQVIAIGKQDIVERAFDVKIKENTAFLSGVVSRKKQVVPRIDSFIG